MTPQTTRHEPETHQAKMIALEQRRAAAWSKAFDSIEKGAKR